MRLSMTTLTGIAISGIICGANSASADPKIVRLPPLDVVVSEDILSAFVDEPSRHFEAARDRFIVGDTGQAAWHLRTASAFLQLEAARATAEGKGALDASIRELQNLALAVENNQVRSVKTLTQAFARAHYALASHHCIKCAHRCGCGVTSDGKCCCNGTANGDQQEMARAGYDLKAATTHLKRGALWENNELDEQTRLAIQASQRAADNLIQQKGESPVTVQRAIHAVHGKLENLTGRQITLAPPIADEGTHGPSVFR